jgi:hypothetical protein
MRNIELNSKVELEGEDVFITRIKSIDTAKSLGDAASDKNWKQLVARLAWAGLPLDADTAEAKLEPLEIRIRAEMAIPSERPGGKRSKGTGFKLHPTFKSYLSTVRSAYDAGVELLDGDGFPRSRDEVINGVKESKTAKNPEEKVLGCFDTFTKVYDKCDPSHANTLAAESAVVAWIEARGYEVLIEVKPAA